VAAEVSRKLLREVESGKETSEQRTRHSEFIRASSQILGLAFDTAIAAGENAVEMKKRVAGWGLADSIILVHAREADARVITGDEHFRRVKESIFIKEKL
jgi:predicted nucleic acid-binding protein